MILAIIIVIFVGLFFIVSNSTNKICWALSLCIFGVCIMLFTGVLYTIKFSYYIPNIHFDYYMYLAISNLKLTMTTLSQLSNIGLTLILTAYMSFAFFLNSGKLWVKCLLIIPIAFFFITNSPAFCYNAYFIIHSASVASKVRFWENVFNLIKIININIFLIYMCIPIVNLIVYNKRTKIFFLKRDAWISVLCITLIDAFLLYIFYFGTYREIMFHKMSLLRFPESTGFINYSFYTPALLLFLVSILVFFITFYKPFHSLFAISEKQFMRNDRQLQQNLRMILHAEKNVFFTIELLAKQGLERKENSDAKFKAILEVAKQSTANLGRTLDLFRDPKMSLKKANLVQCINNALYNVFLPNSNVSVKTNYCNYDALYINMDESHIREVFMNLFRNSQEALSHQNNTPSISVNVIAEEGFAIIDITDNGCGIDKKMLRKIFFPLFSTKPNSSNWGVGLHYVKKVLQLHNGHIRVSSDPWKRTTFEVVIPLAIETKRRFIWKK